MLSVLARTPTMAIAAGTMETLAKGALAEGTTRCQYQYGSVVAVGPALDV